MTIQIGDKTLAISRAGGFEAKLVEATGCSAAEHAAMLTSAATSNQIARALHPMLVDPMPIGDLAEAIDEAGIEQARQDVVALLTATPEPVTKGAKASGDA